MGKRRVVCQVTKEKGLSGEFYRVVHNGRNLYYKDEQTYLNMIKEREIKDEINHFIAIEILNYDSGQYLPPALLKRINDMNKLYPYEVILETFKVNKETLQYWMNQDSKFKNEMARISYMMAIINNNVINEYEKWKIKERRDKENNTVSVDMDLLEVNINNTQKNDGISDFL